MVCGAVNQEVKRKKMVLAVALASADLNNPVRCNEGGR